MRTGQPAVSVGAANDGNLTAVPGGRNTPPAANLPDDGMHPRPEPMSFFAWIALGPMTVWAVLYAFAALQADLGVARENAAFFGPRVQAFCVLNAPAIFCTCAWLALRSRRMRAINKSGRVCAMLFRYPFDVPLFRSLHVWRAAPPSPGSADGAQ